MRNKSTHTYDRVAFEIEPPLYSEKRDLAEAIIDHNSYDRPHVRHLISEQVDTTLKTVSAGLNLSIYADREILAGAVSTLILHTSPTVTVK